MGELEAAAERQNAAWAALRDAIDEYFSSAAAHMRIEHEQSCDDPDCETTKFEAESGPESLSTFVVLAEMTSLSSEGATLTHTSHAFSGSAMAVLGMVTEAQQKIVLRGAGLVVG